MNVAVRGSKLVSMVAVAGCMMFYTPNAWSQRGGRRVQATGARKTETVQLQLDDSSRFGVGPQFPGKRPGTAVAPSVRKPEPIAPGERRVSVLVHLNPALQRGSVVRQEVRAFSALRGAKVKYEYGTVLPNVINLRNLPEAAVAALKNMPGVVKVEEDRKVHAYLARSTPLIRALQSQITGAGLSADGTGVRVCIIDTGIDSDHIMYASRIDTAAGRDFVNNDNNPEDDNGHGSNVAGVAVGGTGLSLTRCGVSETFQGVAPNATLIGVKVLDRNGSGTFSDVIAGIDYCADQTAAGGRADVINMSLGAGQFSTACDGDSAAAAANNAVNAGVVVVAAAGNDGFSNAMGTPACGSKVIAVGAVYDDDFPNCEFPNQSSFTWCLDSFCFNTCTDNTPPVDSLICFSDQSDMLDVTAPGCEITSADNAPGGMTVSAMCGTSQATPHVTGLAALILSADPGLMPADVRQIIRDGAIDLGPAGFDRGYGFGRIDAINSLQLVGPGCVTDADCDDGVFCNGAETCVGGSCQAGTPVNCADGVACTDDSCNEATNSCDHFANNANCDDGLFCNGTETCDAVSDCQAGPAPNCDDGVGCTTDSCNEGTDSCDNIPSDGLCDDGLFCNGAETCDPVFDCQAGTPVNCDDGVACTDDSCNDTTSSCDNIANNANCDDGLFCNGAETCDAVLDCQAGSDPCPGQGCDEVNDVCVQCQTDLDCDDGLFCNGAETCVGGSCQTGTPVNCDDGVACTDDSCNEATDSCDNVANNANCDDGLFCNGAETCDPALDCQGGTPVNCDDGVTCTDDSCNEATASCDNTANNANCPDDGLFCNGAESCDPVADCVSSGNPCAANEVCNEATDTCEPQMTGEGYILSRNPDFSTDDRTYFRNETIYMLVWTDRVDFNDIKKAEWELRDPNKNKAKQPLTNNFDITYTAAFDLSGLPSTATDWTWKATVQDNAGHRYRPTDAIVVLSAPACTVDADCDDADNCTTDVCSGGSCSNTPVNCDDGDACTTDSCAPATGLCNNTPVNCDDGNVCTTDSCDPATGCVNTPPNCDDGDACTTDSCDPATGLCDNVPINCDDGIGCTDDSCDPVTGCSNVPNDANCPDDGLFCNGTESCDPAADCVSSGDPCAANEVCNETTDTCEPQMTGEGFILSRNPDFSTDDRVFNRSETLYMLVWTDRVDFNNIRKAEWELKDPNKRRVKQALTNHFDTTYTAAFDLSGLPSSATDWTWKAKVEDNNRTKYNPTTTITVLP